MVVRSRIYDICCAIRVFKFYILAGTKIPGELMTSEEKARKLLTVLKPLVEEALTSGKEYSIFVTFKRNKIFEITRQVKESQSADGNTKIFVFKKSEL